MRLLFRRILSWLSLAAVVALAWRGYAVVPGGAGAVDEVKWLLDSSRRNPDYNRAGNLVVYAAAGNLTITGCGNPAPPFTLLGVHGASAIAREFSPLFDDETVDKPRLLIVLSDIALRLGGSSRERDALPSLFWEFERWLTSRSDSQLIGMRAELLGVLWSFQDVIASQPRARVIRWIIAGSLPQRRGPDWRVAIDLLTQLRIIDIDVRYRLFQLDRQEDLDRRSPHSVDPPRSWDVRVLQSNERLAEMLNDPVDRIRWGAGRILAVCRDERGLPAVAEWLDRDANAPASAVELMSELFGADWRQRMITRPTMRGAP